VSASSRCRAPPPPPLLAPPLPPPPAPVAFPRGRRLGTSVPALPLARPFRAAVQLPATARERGIYDCRGSALATMSGE
jgi:hypothetical protein